MITLWILGLGDWIAVTIEKQDGGKEAGITNYLGTVIGVIVFFVLMTVIVIHKKQKK